MSGIPLMNFTALYTCTHHGDVRLVGGETSYEGIVEICLNGSWVLVCDSSWNVQESIVVCRQLTGERNPGKGLLFDSKISRLCKT